MRCCSGVQPLTSYSLRLDKVVIILYIQFMIVSLYTVVVQFSRSSIHITHIEVVSLLMCQQALWMQIEDDVKRVKTTLKLRNDITAMSI